MGVRIGIMATPPRPDPHRYARSKLHSAVRILATGRDDVRSRLRDAYRALITLDANRNHVPPEIADDFDWVMKSLTKHEPALSQDGRLEATLARIQKSTGEKIATRIFEMYERLTD